MPEMVEPPGPPEPKTSDDDRVHRGFWTKVRRTLGRVPFLDQAVAAYYCATDRATPGHVKALLLAAIAYFVVPADMIPDFIAGIGFVDDASVLAGAISSVRHHLKPQHHKRARQTLARLRGEASGEADVA
ncbi:MAG: YkvA family protein [Alphaproteobacteria bacterium]|jgi:uncharacterized membrane protein YkvA (DUF1232 family)|nr:hypothetical protein [Rhodospirillaceae bacterium]MDP6405439.1 YkvA family protein [Alphaproteobacteria bacterium]MDP6623585.1 YkvA family protein [Alphaproteobacteria bacterium]|tara:strand:+ start:89 stop:478 length:390 start_codon:yes stop_codon:yes gene_type:complete